MRSSRYLDRDMVFWSLDSSLELFCKVCPWVIVPCLRYGSHFLPEEDPWIGQALSEHDHEFVYSSLMESVWMGNGVHTHVVNLLH